MKNIAGIDLNLLTVFDAMMAERNVTRAANRIGLAQSSTSNALSRLRGLFADELFVRTPSAMVPTDLANRIAPDIAAALEAASRAINVSQSFDPSTAEFTIRLLTTDYVEFVLMPKIVNRLANVAPNVSIQLGLFQNLASNSALDDGNVDLMIGLFPDIPSRHDSANLFKEKFVAIARADHPEIGEFLDLETFIALPQALVSIRGDRIGVVDTALAKIGRQRRVMFSTSNFLGLPFVIAQSDLIAVVPRVLANQAIKIAPLALHPLPFELAGFDLDMVWSKSTSASPQLVWFRDLVLDVSKDAFWTG